MANTQTVWNRRLHILRRRPPEAITAHASGYLRRLLTHRTHCAIMLSSGAVFTLSDRLRRNTDRPSCRRDPTLAKEDVMNKSVGPYHVVDLPPVRRVLSTFLNLGSWEHCIFGFLEMEIPWL